MKRIVVFFIICGIIFTISGCSFKSAHGYTAENGLSLKEEIKNLKSEIDNYKVFYDKSLEESIQKYCEGYLSFQGRIDANNVKKIKKYITAELYNTLINQPFNEGEITQSDYSQQTAPDEIFYENISRRIGKYPEINTTTVLANCYQSVVSNNSTKSYNVICKFEMNRRNNKWLIASAEILS